MFWGSEVWQRSIEALGFSIARSAKRRRVVRYFFGLHRGQFFFGKVQLVHILWKRFTKICVFLFYAHGHNFGLNRFRLKIQPGSKIPAKKKRGNFSRNW